MQIPHQQTVFDMQSITVNASGNACMTVAVPNCYFQVDFVKGCVIYRFGPGNLYSTTGRLIAGVNGGTGTCGCVASANAGANVSLLCSATNGVLSGSTYVMNSPTYNWTTANGNISTGGNTLSPTILLAGTYVLTVTDSLGCTARDTAIVTGHTNVLTPGIIGYDQTYCGPTVPDTLFSVTPATANPGEVIKYQWVKSLVNTPNIYPNPYWSGISGANQTLYVPTNPITASTYYIRCAKTVGCTFVGTTTEGNIVSVIIEDQPTVSLGNDQTVCVGSSVMIDAVNPGLTYNWSTGATTQTIMANISGTYSVIVTDGNCSTTDEMTVTVLPYPTVDLGTDISLCAASATLDAGNAGMTYSWSTGESTRTINATASGSYSVVVSNRNCTASDVINVTLTPSFTVDLGADINTTLCTGSVTLDAGVSGMTYVWNTGEITQTINVSATGTYSVDVTNSAGCMASDVINVNIGSGTLNVDLGNDTILVACTTDSFMLDAGLPGATYVWSTGETTQTIYVTATDSYSVTVTASNGCVASDVISVTLYGAIDLNWGPDVTICGCITLSGYVSGVTSYQWCSGGTYPSKTICTSGVYCVTVSNGVCTASDTISITVNPMPIVDLGKDTTVATTLTLDAGPSGVAYLWNTGATTQILTVTSSGQYIVGVMNADNCLDSDTINVNVISGIAENNAAININIYPNPSKTSGSFTLKFDVVESGNVDVKIMNTLGVAVYSEKLENFTGEYNKKIALENLAPGMYIADISKGNTRNAIKITLE